jgi:hypothetical protein
MKLWRTQAWPVDSLWIKPGLSTGIKIELVVHTFSTSCPHLFHRLINRVIHNFDGLLEA